MRRMRPRAPLTLPSFSAVTHLHREQSQHVSASLDCLLRSSEGQSSRRNITVVPNLPHRTADHGQGLQSLA
jgi:hypothetical protein